MWLKNSGILIIPDSASLAQMAAHIQHKGERQVNNNWRPEGQERGIDEKKTDRRGGNT